MTTHILSVVCYPCLNQFTRITRLFILLCLASPQLISLSEIPVILPVYHSLRKTAGALLCYSGLNLSSLNLATAVIEGIPGASHAFVVSNELFSLQCHSSGSTGSPLRLANASRYLLEAGLCSRAPSDALARTTWSCFWLRLCVAAWVQSPSSASTRLSSIRHVEFNHLSRHHKSHKLYCI